MYRGDKINGIKDWESVCSVTDAQGVQQLSPVTSLLLTLGGNAGYSEITQENAGLVFRRLVALNVIYGSIFRDEDDGPELVITEDVVRRHIGLKSGWQAMTNREFNNAIVRYVKSRVSAYIYDLENPREDNDG